MRVLLVLLGVTGVLAARPAAAYPWMVRHGYTNCGSCHADPSGAGLLSQYGRAQSELLLATRYRAHKEGEEAEASPRTGFALGAAPLPEWLALGVSFRGAWLNNRAGGIDDRRWVQMVTDLRAGLRLGPVRAGAALGYQHTRGQLAALTNSNEDNLVSREHWVGVEVEEPALLLRAGRMNLPFGLRNPEHTSWVRDVTLTDINEHQQHGVALAYNSDVWRAEVMGVLGNLQVSPSDYRERGYAFYAERVLAPRTTLGVSSLMTRARFDLNSLQPYLLRQAHGLFARWSPVPRLVLLAEADWLMRRPQGEDMQHGGVGHLQADVELVQGVHVLGTLEAMRQPSTRGVGAWLTLDWFVLPQVELRVDGVVRRLGEGDEAQNVYTGLAQLHLSL